MSFSAFFHFTSIVNIKICIWKWFWINMYLIITSVNWGNFKRKVVKWKLKSLACELCFFPVWWKSTNPYPAKLIYFKFPPTWSCVEVVSRYLYPQLQVVENHSYLFKLRTKIYKSWVVETYISFPITVIWSTERKNRFKMAVVVISRIRVNPYRDRL